MRAPRIFCLGAHQALRHGLFIHQKRARDRFGRKPADRSQRQRHPGLHAQRRVAAGEDQPQHVVAERIVVRVGRRSLARDRGLGLDIALLGAQPDLTPDAVDCLVAPDVDEPCARVFRHRGPLFERGRECVLHGLLGEFEVTDEADQRRQNATRLVTENLFDLAFAHPVLALRRSQPERRSRHE